MVKTRITPKSGSKWQKRSLLVKMAQNGKNAANSLKNVKMARTWLTRKKG